MALYSIFFSENPKTNSKGMPCKSTCCSVSTLLVPVTGTTEEIIHFASGSPALNLTLLRGSSVNYYLLGFGASSSGGPLIPPPNLSSGLGQGTLLANSATNANMQFTLELAADSAINLRFTVAISLVISPITSPPSYTPVATLTTTFIGSVPAGTMVILPAMDFPVNIPAGTSVGLLVYAQSPQESGVPSTLEVYIGGRIVFS
jgi:hypothetical protein